MRSVWTLALIAAAVAAAPRAAMAGDRAQTPSVVDVGLGISLPYVTGQFRAGAHGCWHDYLLWSGHVTLASTFTLVDLDGDGTPDFSPRNAGPNIGAGMEVGLPLYWRLRASVAELTQDGKVVGVTHVGQLDQISVVGGLRAGIGESHPVAAAFGLHASRSSVLPEGLHDYYRETSVQLRSLWFAPDARFGIDGEVMWMPFRRLALVLYGEMMPRLGVVFPPRDHCDGSLYDCQPNYPISIFNPRAEKPYAQIGVRVQVVAR